MKKKTIEVRLLSTAEDDFQQIISDRLMKSRQSALHLASDFEKSFLNLAVFPLMGRVPRQAILADMGYRTIVVADHLVFYEYEKGVVLIHRIIYGARDYLHLIEKPLP